MGNAPLSAAAGEQPPPWRRVFQVLGKSLPAPPAPEAQTHLPSRFPRDGTFHRLPSTRSQPSFPLDKKVEGPAPFWGQARAEFAILFGERFPVEAV